MASKPHIIILGAGPAGLGAAYQLVHKKLAKVSVIEERETVGGNAASFQVSGMWVDYGSHRLHPSCDPEILHDIHLLLNNDLLDRPRHGRIRLKGRWIHFPLKPLDLMLNLPASFSFNATIDILRKSFQGNRGDLDSASFASVLEKGLGRTVCREFYFPYAQKIWGLPPEDMSAEQAHRRVSAKSMQKMLQKVLGAVSASKNSKGSRFFYPKKGFGQISTSLYNNAMTAGAEFFLGSRLTTVQMEDQSIDAICCERGGRIDTYRGDYFWSTIPVTTLLQSIRPSPPAIALKASEYIKYRAMILVYIVLEQERFSEYDAHYFPSVEIPITRLSEPKNYSDTLEPLNRTVLCAELPCFTTDPEWALSDRELEGLVCDSLDAAGIPVKAPVIQTITHRLRYAYPIYGKDYETHLDQIDRWLAGVENLLSFGRQGLFVHDNTHHALYMGYAAVKCLNGDGSFDHNRWKHYRRIFDTHVVED